MVGGGGVVDGGGGSLVGGGGGVAGLIFGVLGLTLVLHVSDITIRSRDVCHDLCSAVRKSNLVSSSSIVTITLLMGVEVGEGVVILDGVGVLVHGGEVGVCWLSWIGWGGTTSCGEKSGRKESL